MKIGELFDKIKPKNRLMLAVIPAPDGTWEEVAGIDVVPFKMVQPHRMSGGEYSGRYEEAREGDEVAGWMVQIHSGGR